MYKNIDSSESQENIWIFLPEKNSSRNVFTQENLLREIIPGVNIPKEYEFLSKSS